MKDNFCSPRSCCSDQWRFWILCSDSWRSKARKSHARALHSGVRVTLIVCNVVIEKGASIGSDLDLWTRGPKEKPNDGQLLNSQFLDGTNARRPANTRILVTEPTPTRTPHTNTKRRWRNGPKIVDIGWKETEKRRQGCRDEKLNGKLLSSRCRTSKATERRRRSDRSRPKY